MSADSIFIGTVEGGEFKLLSSGSGSSGEVRLTSISMQESRLPESGEIDLTKYEGMAIAVQWHDGGGWIYNANIIDSGGPLVTALARAVFGEKGV